LSKEIIVIGAGVVGLSTAYYCAQRGHHVTVIDRGKPDDENCSYGNAGLVCPSHIIPLAAPGMVALGLKWMWSPESPFYVKPRLSPSLLRWGWQFYRAANTQRVNQAAPLLRDLNVASRTCFEEFAKHHGNSFSFEHRGLLCLCKTERKLEHEAHVAKHATELGLKTDVLGPKQTAALDPNIRMDIAGAVYFADDCHLVPGRFMAALKQQVKDLGVNVSWNTTARAWRHARGHIEALSTDKGDLQAAEYVVCAGSWSQNFLRPIGVHIPLQAGKGYSLTLPQPQHLPTIPAILTEARVAVTPMAGALRFGGTMEIAGLNEDINPARIRGIVKSVPAYYPDFGPDDFAAVQPWRGLRPCSPDGLPYVGRPSRFSNLCVATGHAMLGLSLGPVTGKLVSEIISDEMPSLDMELLNPDRYR
jgi:D-amino-acid dehydrogenase